MHKRPLATIGSSPLAWGALRRRPTDRPCRRFIPTRVGSIYETPDEEPLRAVHPHSRGEHAIKLDYAPSFPGSSPLAWGA